MTSVTIVMRDGLGECMYSGTHLYLRVIGPLLEVRLREPLGEGHMRRVVAMPLDKVAGDAHRSPPTRAESPFDASDRSGAFS